MTVKELRECRNALFDGDAGDEYRHYRCRVHLANMGDYELRSWYEKQTATTPGGFLAAFWQRVKDRNFEIN